MSRHRSRIHPVTVLNSLGSPSRLSDPPEIPRPGSASLVSSPHAGCDRAVEDIKHAKNVDRGGRDNGRRARSPRHSHPASRQRLHGRTGSWRCPFRMRARIAPPIRSRGQPILMERFASSRRPRGCVRLNVSFSNDPSAVNLRLDRVGRGIGPYHHEIAAALRGQRGLLPGSVDRQRAREVLIRVIPLCINSFRRSIKVQERIDRLRRTRRPASPPPTDWHRCRVVWSRRVRRTLPP